MDRDIPPRDSKPHDGVRARRVAAFEARSETPPPAELPSALDEFDAVAVLLAGKRAAVFLDYDGTLTPIVRDPDAARMAPEMREIVRCLAAVAPVAVVSGRDRAVVEQFVQLDQLVYAGSHGFDIRGPGFYREHEGGAASLADLDAAEKRLDERLASVGGAQVERKRFAVAVHYRNAADADAPTVEAAVDEVHAALPKLRKRGGKKVFELLPDIPWDKGGAVLWLLEMLDLDRPDVLPFYLGDDLTDEDAFRAMAGRGLGIIVGGHAPTTAATMMLRDPDEVQRFLKKLADLLRGRLE